jgi:16S rRNA (cytidine1402-2'-O)-methyltransferase
VLDEEGYDALPGYLVPAIKNCQVFFVENERTARRYFKRLWKEMVIDSYGWHTMNGEPAVAIAFREALRANRNVGIVSEAGCPGVADPGQALVAIAQEMGVRVIPLAGPNAILLALMASGMNGQQFHFAGYLPIDNQERARTIRELEAESARRNMTQVFIETPYRNQQMLDALRNTCKPSTKICVAVDITGRNEWIRTLSAEQWKGETASLHKRPAVFLLYAGNPATDLS